MDLRAASVLGHAAKILGRRGEEKPRRAGINRFVREALAESPLVQVVDVLLIAVERGLETEETLGHLFGVPY
jgi:hypothetical protein